MSAQPAGLAGPHVHIVPMRRRHLRSVLRIEGQVYPRPWSLGAFLSELSLRTSRVYVVAKESGSVVGFAGLMVTLDEGHVTTIAVDPSDQRRGIGARLLLTLSRAAIARGCVGLTLEVRVSNEPAQAMYRRFGYAPAGIRKGYYAENNEDALVMWAHDVDLPEYTARLDGIEAGLAGTTTYEEGIVP
jgi:ribosomal-protein-alanine N-acetyltransferase